MLKIGELARICNVSTQTLRFYDEEGVLCPDRIDSRTGYRYYAPEKVELFHQIQGYKDVGFSLAEIKELLRADPIRRSVLTSEKIREINLRVRNLQNNLSRLENLNDRGYPQSMEALLSGAEFEDQPEVLGIWELCGRLETPTNGVIPDHTAPLETKPWPEAIQRLVFLPNGAPWWMYSWTRGVLYWMSGMPYTIVPNPFVLWETAEARYMTLQYRATRAHLDHGEEPLWLLYRQVKHAALTKAESRAFIDDTDLPVVADAEVLGDWESLGWTRDPMVFSLAELPVIRKPLWIAGMTFSEDNTCIHRVSQGEQRVDWRLTYTRFACPTEEARGAVLSLPMQVAETYLLREMEGEILLFVQHKSGDYIYGGRTPVWYVFRRTGKQNPIQS